jgi:hypothetical protein
MCEVAGAGRRTRASFLLEEDERKHDGAATFSLPGSTTLKVAGLTMGSGASGLQVDLAKVQFQPVRSSSFLYGPRGV